jgi:ubiquinone/menaquinone biosynthesis C-methylase UbiE
MRWIGGWRSLYLIEMEIKEKGSYQGWNNLWEVEVSNRIINPHFTRTEVKTIYQFWQKAYANDLLSLIQRKNYSRFCELGSGRATTSLYLANCGYSDITLVDLAEQGFIIAKNSFEYYKFESPKFLLANVEDTGIDSEAFDCIYNIGLLEHFIDPKLTLKEAHRLLKKDGMIFMPIVPTLPFRKSILCRIFFNPLSILKKGIKSMLGFESKFNSANDILRTDYSKEHYVNICKELGYKNVECISYNPYWKVNDDGFIENNITLPLYKFYYNLFKRKKIISLDTSGPFEFCYLLIAYK